MSRTRRLFQGVAVGYISMAVMTIGGMWLTAFLLARLGQEEYGSWLLVARVLGYLALLDLGIVALVPRETAYATGHAGGVDAARDLGTLTGRSIRLTLWQVPMVAAATLVVWFLVPSEWANVRPALAIVSVAFVVTFPLRIFEALLQGLQDLAVAGWIQTARWLITTLTVIAFVLAHYGISSLAFGWAVGQFAGAGMALWRLWSRFPWALPRQLTSISWPEARAQLGRGLWVSVSKVGQTLLNNTDLLVIGAILGPGPVVTYFCTAKVIDILAHQPQILMQAAAPALSELKTAESAPRRVQATSAISQAMMLMSGGIAIIVLATNEAFVIWWVGSPRWGGLELTLALVVRTLLRHWNVTTIYALFAFGYERRLALTVTLDGVVTTAVTVWLVWALGLVGAPLGALAGVCLVSLPGNLRALSRETATPLASLMGSQWQWGWRMALLATGVGLVSANWRLPPQPLVIVGVAAAVGTAYAALMAPLVRRPPLSHYVPPQLRRAIPLLGRLDPVADDVPDTPK